MRRGMTGSETVSWLTSANVGATSLTRKRETPVLAEKGSAPMPTESMAFQRPASGLRTPHVLRPESYLDRPGGNLKDNNDDCCQEEFTQGHLPLCGGVRDTTAGNRTLQVQHVFWGLRQLLNCNSLPHPNSGQLGLNSKYQVLVVFFSLETKYQSNTKPFFSVP